MSTKTSSSPLDQIGNAAGKVWQSLHKDGAISVTKLVDNIDLNRDLIMQAIGWLAREGKLHITETKRGRILALREQSNGDSQA